MADAVSPDLDRPTTGIFWMLVTGLCFVGVQASVKALGPGVPAAQAAFIRFAFGLVILLPMLRGLLRMRLSAADLRWFGLRGAFHTLGVICWFYAMTRITLAEVTALNYLAPVYVTLGAALFLGERLAARRLGAIVAALAGALVLLRPGFREIGPGHLAMLVTGLALGGSYLVAKHLSARHGADVVVALLSLSVAIGLAPFAIAVWVPVGLRELGLLALVAGFATAGHYTMILSFRAAPVGVTQPVTFLQLVWAVLVGWAAFGEPVDGWVVAGGLLIFASVAYIAWREHVLKRSRIIPDAVEVKG